MSDRVRAIRGLRVFCVILVYVLQHCISELRPTKHTFCKLNHFLYINPTGARILKQCDASSIV